MAISDLIEYYIKIKGVKFKVLNFSFIIKYKTSIEEISPHHKSMNPALNNLLLAHIVRNEVSSSLIWFHWSFRWSFLWESSWSRRWNRSSISWTSLILLIRLAIIWDSWMLWLLRNFEFRGLIYILNHIFPWLTSSFYHGDLTLLPYLRMWLMIIDKYFFSLTISYFKIWLISWIYNLTHIAYCFN